MLSKENIIALASEELHNVSSQKRPPFDIWPEVEVGAPVLVHDVGGTPSYWLVPYRNGDLVIGFCRIRTSGRLFAVGSFCHKHRQMLECPREVTGITTEEALQIINENDLLAANEQNSNPVFVHDGPVGREAWLVVVSKNGHPARWIFVSAAGYYERPAGVRLGENFEA
jgi:hypothetical protein